MTTGSKSVNWTFTLQTQYDWVVATQIFFYFHPYGEMIHKFDWYSSDGWFNPPTRWPIDSLLIAWYPLLQGPENRCIGRPTGAGNHGVWCIGPAGAGGTHCGTTRVGERGIHQGASQVPWSDDISSGLFCFFCRCSFFLDMTSWCYSCCSAHVYNCFRWASWYYGTMM